MEKCLLARVATPGAVSTGVQKYLSYPTLIIVHCLQAKRISVDYISQWADSLRNASLWLPHSSAAGVFFLSWWDCRWFYSLIWALTSALCVISKKTYWKTFYAGCPSVECRRRVLWEKSCLTYIYIYLPDYIFLSSPGYFIYLDTQGRVDGDSAMLYSHDLTAGRDYCMTFWYLYSGAGTLQVLWRYPKEEEMYLLWQEPRSTGDVWLYQTVTLSSPDVIQVCFIMIRREWCHEKNYKKNSSLHASLI